MKTREMKVLALVCLVLAFGSFLMQANLKGSLARETERQKTLTKRRRELKKRLSDYYALALAARIGTASEKELAFVVTTVPGLTIVSGRENSYVLQYAPVTDTTGEVQAVLSMLRKTLCHTENAGRQCVFLESLHPVRFRVFTKAGSPPESRSRARRPAKGA